MKTNFDLLIFIFMINIITFLVKAQSNKGSMIVKFKEGIPIEDESFNKEYSGEMNSIINKMDNSFTIEFKTDILDFSEFFNNIFPDEYEFIISIKFLDIKISGIKNMNAMFRGLLFLKNIEGLENFDTSQVIDMSSIFEGCLSLTSINFANFITSSVTKMAGMFILCFSLESIDVSNFDTSLVTTMDRMFDFVLNEINVSNFNTLSVTTMKNMFSINSIESFAESYDKEISKSLSQKIIGLSSFNTSSVINMHGMFKGNNFLESLDLSNFDASKVTYMSYMFYYCENLKSLDILISI